MYFSITGMDDTKKSGNSTFTLEEKKKFQALMNIPFFMLSISRIVRKITAANEK